MMMSSSLTPIRRCSSLGLSVMVLLLSLSRIIEAFVIVTSPSWQTTPQQSKKIVPSNFNCLASRRCGSRYVTFVAAQSTSNTPEDKDDTATTTTTSTASGSSNDPNQISATQIYFDIAVANQAVGRLVFHLTNPSPLPLYTENLIQLAKGSRRSIDPLAHYVGCAFEFSPLYIEDGQGRYRWSHVLKGRGRNAVGRSDELIFEAENQLKCTQTAFGGQYYGDKYNQETEENDDVDDPGVLLTVTVAGPGRGSSRFSIVRVGESPPEWGERLLLNSGVVGRMDPDSLDTLHAMARQRRGPPTVTACGVLE